MSPRYSWEARVKNAEAIVPRGDRIKRIYRTPVPMSLSEYRIKCRGCMIDHRDRPHTGIVDCDASSDDQCHPDSGQTIQSDTAREKTPDGQNRPSCLHRERWGIGLPNRKRS